ncbi:hypothetical protein PCANB_001109 [Pneumocystis canis]|nr:hypothetical protein PCANB_001109 [Pneumocystis canis]
MLISDKKQIFSQNDENKRENSRKEFGGPLGTMIVILVTPLIVYKLYFLCNENDCKISTGRIFEGIFSLERLYEPMAFIMYFLWWIFLIVSWAFLPGYFKQGNTLSDGSNLTYKINGKFFQLYFSNGFQFYMGRELNPRIGSFDIKEFVELRPGIILWVILNLSFAAHQYILLDGKITNSMILVCLFQIWYCIDSLWNEELVLTTMDITTEGFGFMLCFGSITWVPFTYSFQARYLAFHPVDLNNYAVIGIVLLQCLGFWIFRSANRQKDTFRNNPTSSSVQHLTYITTERGTKLITNGWWGDWLMAWAWCLPTGFKNPITYFYVVYSAILLIHRERRDNYMCSIKYGKDWEKYCHQLYYCGQGIYKTDIMTINNENWSRKLCKVLRHCALDYGLHMRNDGFVSVDALLKHTAFQNLTVAQLKQIVAENEKSRFILHTNPETGELLIRATQGHSIPVQDDLLLKRILSKDQFPEITVHATTYKNWIQICKSGGLCVMKRNHIHLTSYPECLDGKTVPKIRSSANVLVLIDTQTAFDHGVPFFWSTNNVLLTPGALETPGWLPMRYLKGAITRSGDPLSPSPNLSTVLGIKK